MSGRQQVRPSMSVSRDISNKYIYQVTYHQVHIKQLNWWWAMKPYWSSDNISSQYFTPTYSQPPRHKCSITQSLVLSLILWMDKNFIINFYQFTISAVWNLQFFMFLFFLSNKLTLVYDNDVCFLLYLQIVLLVSQYILHVFKQEYFGTVIFWQLDFKRHMVYGSNMCLFTQFIQQIYTECLFFGKYRSWHME